MSAARRYAMVLWLIAAPALAAPFDPFPDQPGALSADELKALSEAVKLLPGAAAAFQLVASGKRAPGQHPQNMPLYALFATPLEDFSAQVKVRKQILCNYGGAWRCNNPSDQFRMTANGIEHVFTFETMQVAADRQAAVDTARFMYSPCFAARFAEIGGKPFTPSPDADYVNTVVVNANGINVGTGPRSDGNSYRLERTERKKDGCDFRIQHARLAATGAFLPESYAKEVAKQQAEAREQLAAAQRAQDGRAQGTISFLGLKVNAELLAMSTMWGAMTLGAIALIAPWFVLLAWGRSVAATTAGGLAAACTVVALISAVTMPAMYNIRIDVLINGALALAAWLQFGALSAWAAFSDRR